jgi:RNA polymerase sigma-70 factor (ECF subfamily)
LPNRDALPDHTFLGTELLPGKVMKDPNVDPGRTDSGHVGSTSSSLLERAVRQTPGAWERLVALYGPLSYSWARRAGLPPEDSADVVQEVFRAVATHLAGFRHERKSDTFRGWLWTITRNKVRDLRRRQAGRPNAEGGTDAHQRLLEVPAGPDSGSADSAFSSTAPLLARALERIRSEFEERTWQAFRAVVMEGRSPADVAASLGLSVNAVYIARSRVLRRLRDELDDPPP